MPVYYTSNQTVDIMEDERRENRGAAGITLLTGLIIGLAIGYIVGIKGYIRVENENDLPQATVSETSVDVTEPANDESKTKNEPAPIVEKTTKKTATGKSVTPAKEGSRTTSTSSKQTRERKEAGSTQKKGNHTGQTITFQAPIVAQSQSGQKPTTSTQEMQEGTDENAVTLASYSHDWVQPNAQVSLKNNTDRDIVSVTGRMIYYDMSGNMLDYQDFTERIHIDAGMTKRFALRGYNNEEHYAYYKSQTIPGEEYKKYKVKFQLKSYKMTPKSGEESTDATQKPNTSTNEKGVTMVSYSHDWVKQNAQVSLKNNTNRDIVSITGRMIYYDMSGKMLDYQDFTKRVDIETGMTKRLELRGYNNEEHYAYYKSQTIPGEEYKKYKVKFQLKSFTYK